MLDSMQIEETILKVRSPTSVVVLDSESPKSDYSHVFHVVPGQIDQEVPRLPCQTDLLYAQKDRITHLEQRIKDLEDDLAHEISLREHYQQEAVDANDASEEFFLTTVQMAANISTTERQLELKFLSMQHSLAVWESWAAQHGIPVVQNKDTNHTPVFPAAAPEDTASSSN